MKKRKTNTTKEVVIMVLLLILIILILAVALYDFIPSNISLPESISYSSDSATTSVKQEIAYTNGGDMTADQDGMTDEELMTSLKSYSIQSSDLTVYSQKNLYNSGNSNPFDDLEEETDNTTEDTTTTTDGTTTTTTSTSTSQTTTTSGESSTGTFFESKTSK